MRPAAARQVAFGQNGELERREYETPVDAALRRRGHRLLPRRRVGRSPQGHLRPPRQIPSSCSERASRAALASFSAHTTTVKRFALSSRNWAKSRSGPPATGSQPIVLIVGVPGPSGAGVSMATEALVPLSSRSKGK